MTELKRRLAEEWVIDFNAQKAGERAGIQGNNIRITAWQMLQDEEVQAYIEKLQLEAAKRCEITKDQWLNEWKILGFSNIQDYINNNLSIKDLSEVPNSQAIKSIKKSVTEFDGGEKTTIEFQLHDKVAALTNIGKHLGFYNLDNEQQKPINVINFQPIVNTNSPPLSENEK